MKFKFQNKREVFLIHEDNEKQGLWVEPGWDDQDYHSPSKPAWEDWEIVYPTSEDPIPAPYTPSKKTKKVWRKKNKMSSTATTSPGTDETTST